jgi:hypothetical protein
MRVWKFAPARACVSMYGYVLAGLALAASPMMSHAAAARPVQCKLTVDGKSFTNGDCDFEPLGTDGSFILRAKSGIFVYITVNAPGVADASWNEQPSSTHAQAPLGEVRQQGACWSNKRTILCAWQPGQAPTRPIAEVAPPATTQATAPRVANPSPEAAKQKAGLLTLSGLRSGTACMIAESAKKGAHLVVGKGDECSGPNAHFVLGSDNIVQLAQAPEFCVASKDRAGEPAFVGECAAASLLVYNADERSVGAVAGEALCLGLQGRPEESQIASGQPFISKTCAKALDQTLSWQAVKGAAQPAADTTAPASAQAQTAASGLSASSFKPVSNDDLSKLDFGGCSFTLSRGEDMLVLVDIEHPKKRAVFKIDGKLAIIEASAASPGAYWTGNSGGAVLRLIKGKRDPKYKNDGGGQGGDGRLEWSGAKGAGALPLRWEEGC